MIDVTAAVLIENGKVLIARRRPGASQAGLWELPGGKVRAGESPAQCLKREIREELGIEIVVEEFFGESVYDDPRNDQAPFSAYTLSQRRRPGIDWKWVSYVTITEPVSSAWAAIHTSLIGRGVPDFYVALRIFTDGFIRNRCRVSLLSRYLDPPAPGFSLSSD